jgi:uncharacterized protein (DUF58 family)
MSVRAARTELVLTPAGTILLPAAIVGVLASASFVPAAALASAAALSVLLLAPLGAWLCLRGLVMLPPPPRQAFVGEGFPVTLEVENRSFLFAARHVFLWHGRGKRRRDQLPSGRIDRRAARSRGRVTTLYRMLERGRHASLRLVACSSYPFGLVECRREFELAVDFLALPCPGRLGDLRRLMPAQSGAALDARRPLLGEEELYGVHEWRPGESLRRAHWKLSARRGRTLLREFRGAGRPPVHLVLSCWVPQRGAGRHASFERAVRLTATLAQHFLREGHRLRLTLEGPEPISLHSARGGRTLVLFLTVLAQVQPSAGAPRQASALAAAPPSLRDDVLLLVRAGGKRHVRGPARDARIVLDVDDPAIERVFHAERAPHARLVLS